MANTGLNRFYLAEGVDYSLDCYETKRNLNTLVVACTGAGKTRSIVTPNLLACSGSYVISDPKGNLYTKYRKFLQEQGYQVRLVDLVNLTRGEGFNFLKGLETEDEIMSAAAAIQQSHTDDRHTNSDKFWEHTECMTLAGAISAIVDTAKLLEDTPDSIPASVEYAELTGFRLSDLICKRVILRRGNRYPRTVKAINDILDDMLEETTADLELRRSCVEHYIKQFAEQRSLSSRLLRLSCDMDSEEYRLGRDLNDKYTQILKNLEGADSVDRLLRAADQMYDQAAVVVSLADSPEVRQRVSKFLSDFADSVQDYLERILSHDYFSQYALLCALHPDSYGVRQLKRIQNMSAEKTLSNIIISTQAPLSMIDTHEVNEMMARAEKTSFNFTSIGTRKTALFVCVSDTDRRMDAFASLFFTRAMQELSHYADTQCRDNALPIHVRFVLDDFATNVKLREMPRAISSFRSRNISVMLIVQSEGQLERYYGPDAQTIIANCDQYLFAGTQSLKDAETISRKVNKPVEDILYMPIGQCIVFRRGDRPIFAKLIDHDRFLKWVGFTQEPIREEREQTMLDTAV